MNNSEEQENKRIVLIVYGDPVPKARARTVTTVGKHGQRMTHSYTPEKTKNQEYVIAMAYKHVYHDFKFEEGTPLVFKADMFVAIPKSTPRKKREAMLAGEIRPTVRNMDVDNGLKLAMDALLKVAYDDDSQIVEATGRKFYSDSPRTEIFITKVGEGDVSD